MGEIESPCISPQVSHTEEWRIPLHLRLTIGIADGGSLQNTPHGMSQESYA